MVPTGWPSELFTAVPAVNSAWSRACASACAFAAAASRSALVVDATSPFSFDPIAAGGSATLLVPVFTTTASAVTVSIVPIATVTRSEEHTSELQSLMRISYAVFCLKKKRNYADTSATKQQINIHTPTHTLRREISVVQSRQKHNH